MDDDLLNQISSILSEKNIDINQLLNNLKNSSSDENTSGKTNNQEQTIDAETLIKIQKLMSLLNSQKNSKDETLLKALKPYMRDSKKEKIDKYIKLLHVFNLLENFQEMGGNLNDFL